MNHLLVDDTIGEAISHLKNVLYSRHCRNMSKSNIVGYLGELLVRRMLEDENRVVTPRGNQSAVDLEYDTANGKIRIDVKTSTLKTEFLKKREGFVHWGWAMRAKGESKSPTQFVFVGIILPRSYCIRQLRAHAGRRFFGANMIRQYFRRIAKLRYSFVRLVRMGPTIMDRSCTSSF